MLPSFVLVIPLLRYFMYEGRSTSSPLVAYTRELEHPLKGRVRKFLPLLLSDLLICML